MSVLEKDVESNTISEFKIDIEANQIPTTK